MKVLILDFEKRKRRWDSVFTHVGALNPFVGTEFNISFITVNHPDRNIILDELTQRTSSLEYDLILINSFDNGNGDFPLGVAIADEIARPGALNFHGKIILFFEIFHNCGSEDGFGQLLWSPSFHYDFFELSDDVRIVANDVARTIAPRAIKTFIILNDIPNEADEWRLAIQSFSRNRRIKYNIVKIIAGSSTEFLTRFRNMLLNNRISFDFIVLDLHFRDADGQEELDGGANFWLSLSPLEQSHFVGIRLLATARRRLDEGPAIMLEHDHRFLVATTASTRDAKVGLLERQTRNLRGW